MANTFNHNDKVVITDDGSVGIGKTSSISAPLNVFSSSTVNIAKFENNATGIQVTIGDSSNTLYSNTVWVTDSGTGEIFKHGTANTSWGGASSLNVYNSNGAIAFHPSNTANAMFINTSGNVGIGTTSPGSSFKLDVNGYIKANSRVYVRDSTKTVEIGTDYIQSYVTSGTGVNPIRFFTGSTEKARIDGNGNVGIGTTSPNSKLEVVSAITFSSIDTFGQFVIKSATGATGDLLNFGVDSTNGLAFIQANDRGTATIPLSLQRYGGNVGIGTTNPSSKLHVYQASSGVTPYSLTGGINIESNSITGINIMSPDTGYGRIYFGAPTGGSTTGAIEYIHNANVSAGYMKLRVGAVDRVFILGNGNVGIGTTSPDGKLNIKASYTSSSTITNDASDYAVNVDFIGTNGSIASPQYGAHFAIRDSNGAAVAAINGVDQGASGATGLSFLTGDVNGLSDRLHITYTGNVGIGTTSPDQKLVVNGSIKIGAAYYFFGGNPPNPSDTTAALYDGSGVGPTLSGLSVAFRAGTTTPAEIMRVTSAGLGIGTTSPGAKLDIAGTNSSLALSYGNTVPNNPLHTNYYGGYTGIGMDSATAGVRIVGDTNTLVMDAGSYTSQSPQHANWNSLLRVMTNGNVGIGTTSPADKLHVEGSVTLSNSSPEITFQTGATHYNWQIAAQENVNAAFEISVGSQDADASNDTWSPKMVVLQSGNVGIGTTSPAKKLVVAASSQTWAGAPQIAFYDTVSGQAGARNWTVGAISTNYGNFTIASSTAAGGDPTTARLTIDNAGNVGIGTTSPVEKLMVSNAGAEAIHFNPAYLGQSYIYSYNRSTSGYVDLILQSLNLIFHSNGGNERMRITSGGNVGIGTTSPDSKFHVEDTNPEVRITGTGGTSFPRLLWEYPVSATQASRWALTASASGNTFYLYNYTQSKKIFQVDGTASHITLNHDAAGTTQIGTSTTQTAYQLYVATNVGQTGAIEAAGSVKITSGALGVNIAASATAGRIDASNDIVAYSTSDYRLKENIKPLENATEKVKKLTGVEFDWKQEHKAVHGYEGHDVGVIAQEVQEVLPEAIRTNDSGYLSVRYEKLIGLLIESNKELAARVEELEQKLKQ